MPQKPRTLSRSRPTATIAGPKRGSAHARGYTRSWSATAKRVLADVGRTEFLHGGPLCPCGAAATCVDHIRPHKGNQDLFWDAANLQSLCDSCHSRKTVAEDGGFGGSGVGPGLPTTTATRIGSPPFSGTTTSRYRPGEAAARAGAATRVPVTVGCHC